MSSCHKTEQGVKKIKECQIPSTIEILMEMRSSCTLSKDLSSVVKDLIDQTDDLIDQTDSSTQGLVVQKSSIEKLATNPCETLPNVAGQDEIRPFQGEIVDLKSPSKSIEIVSATSMLGCQQGKDKTVGCDKTDPTGSKTGIIASSRVLQNKLKPNMVKLKKPKIGVWKTV